MKQKLIVFSTGLTILSAVAFMGCGQEDGLLTDDDLSINSQVPKRRAPSEQWTNPDPNKFSYEDNECCLVALVEAKQQKMFEHTFTTEKTAQDFYYELKNSAWKMKKEDGTPWNYEGGEMDLELFMQLGQKYNLLSDRVDFSNNVDREGYFDNKKNKPKMILIEVEIEDKKTKTKKKVKHVAHIKNINREKGTVTTSEATIDINEIMAVWM